MQSRQIDFAKHVFSRVVELPDDYEVFDFTSGYDPFRPLKSPYGVGKYNEKRVGVYTSPLFGGVRNIHVGIDIGAPVGTAVHSFADGEIFLFGYNGAPGDYGNTIITKHTFDGVDLFALYGHLQKRSLDGLRVGKPIARGEIIAWIGDRHENGGWNPHLHFQLSYRAPTVPDLPGVVSESDRAEALAIYPDPRLVLGALY